MHETQLERPVNVCPQAINPSIPHLVLSSAYFVEPRLALFRFYFIGIEFALENLMASDLANF